MQAAVPKQDTGQIGMIVKRVSVPIGLEELMEGLTKEVLLKKPKDLCVFASEYFSRLVILRERSSHKAYTVRTMQSVTHLRTENKKLPLNRPSKRLSRQTSTQSKAPVQPKVTQVKPKEAIKTPLRRDKSKESTPRQQSKPSAAVSKTSTGRIKSDKKATAASKPPTTVAQPLDSDIWAATTNVQEVTKLIDEKKTEEAHAETETKAPEGLKINQSSSSGKEELHEMDSDANSEIVVNKPLEASCTDEPTNSSTESKTGGIKGLLNHTDMKTVDESNAIPLGGNRQETEADSEEIKDSVPKKDLTANEDGNNELLDDEVGRKGDNAQENASQTETGHGITDGETEKEADKTQNVIDGDSEEMGKKELSSESATLRLRYLGPNPSFTPEVKQNDKEVQIKMEQMGQSDDVLTISILEKSDDAQDEGNNSEEKTEEAKSKKSPVHIESGEKRHFFPTNEELVSEEADNIRQETNKDNVEENVNAQDNNDDVKTDKEVTKEDSKKPGRVHTPVKTLLTSFLANEKQDVFKTTDLAAANQNNPAFKEVKDAPDGNFAIESMEVKSEISRTKKDDDSLNFNSSKESSEASNSLKLIIKETDSSDSNLISQSVITDSEVPPASNNETAADAASITEVSVDAAADQAEGDVTSDPLFKEDKGISKENTFIMRDAGGVPEKAPDEVACVANDDKSSVAAAQELLNTFLRNERQHVFRNANCKMEDTKVASDNLNVDRRENDTKVRRAKSVGIIKLGEHEAKSKIPTLVRRSAGRRPLVRQSDADSKELEEKLNFKKSSSGSSKENDAKQNRNAEKHINKREARSANNLEIIRHGAAAKIQKNWRSFQARRQSKVGAQSRDLPHHEVGKSGEIQRHLEQKSQEEENNGDEHGKDDDGGQENKVEAKQDLNDDENRPKANQRVQETFDEPTEKVVEVKNAVELDKRQESQENHGKDDDGGQENKEEAKQDLNDDENRPEANQRVHETFDEPTEKVVQVKNAAELDKRRECQENHGKDDVGGQKNKGEAKQDLNDDENRPEADRSVQETFDGLAKNVVQVKNAVELVKRQESQENHGKDEDGGQKNKENVKEVFNDDENKPEADRSVQETFDGPTEKVVQVKNAVELDKRPESQENHGKDDVGGQKNKGEAKQDLNDDENKPEADRRVHETFDEPTEKVVQVKNAAELDKRRECQENHGKDDVGGQKNKGEAKQDLNDDENRPEADRSVQETFDGLAKNVVQVKNAVELVKRQESQENHGKDEDGGQKNKENVKEVFNDDENKPEADRSVQETFDGPTEKVVQVKNAVELDKRPESQENHGKDDVGGQKNKGEAKQDLNDDENKPEADRRVQETFDGPTEKVVQVKNAVELDKRQESQENHGKDEDGGQGNKGEAKQDLNDNENRPEADRSVQETFDGLAKNVVQVKNAVELDKKQESQENHGKDDDGGQENKEEAKQDLNDNENRPEGDRSVQETFDGLAKNVVQVKNAVALDKKQESQENHGKDEDGGQKNKENVKEVFNDDENKPEADRSVQETFDGPTEKVVQVKNAVELDKRPESQENHGKDDVGGQKNKGEAKQDLNDDENKPEADRRVQETFDGPTEKVVQVKNAVELDKRQESQENHGKDEDGGQGNKGEAKQDLNDNENRPEADRSVQETFDGLAKNVVQVKNAVELDKKQESQKNHGKDEDGGQKNEENVKEVFNDDENKPEADRSVQETFDGAIEIVDQLKVTPQERKLEADGSKSTDKPDVAHENKFQKNKDDLVDTSDGGSILNIEVNKIEKIDKNIESNIKTNDSNNTKGTQKEPVLLKEVGPVEKHENRNKSGENGSNSNGDDENIKKEENIEPRPNKDDEISVESEQINTVTGSSEEGGKSIENGPWKTVENFESNKSANINETDDKNDTKSDKNNENIEKENHIEAKSGEEDKNSTQLSQKTIETSQKLENTFVDAHVDTTTKEETGGTGVADKTAQNQTKENAAIKIQSAWKGFVAKKSMKISQDRNSKNAHEQAIIKIQAIVRRFLDRIRFEKLKLAKFDVMKSRTNTVEEPTCTMKTISHLGEDSIKPQNEHFAVATGPKDDNNNTNKAETLLEKEVRSAIHNIMIDATNKDKLTPLEAEVSQAVKQIMKNDNGKAEEIIPNNVIDIDSMLKQLPEVPKTDPSSSLDAPDDRSSVSSVDSIVTVIMKPKNEDKQNAANPPKRLTNKALSTSALEDHVELLDQVQNSLLDQLSGKTLGIEELHDAATLYNSSSVVGQEPDDVMQYLYDFEQEDGRTYRTPPPLRDLPDIAEETESKEEDFCGSSKLNVHKQDRLIADTGKLRHTSEFHDTVIVPLSDVAAPKTNDETKDVPVAGTSRANTMDSGNQTAIQQPPAGVEAVTSRRRPHDGVDDVAGAQASLKDTSSAKLESGGSFTHQSPPPQSPRTAEQAMESENDNNKRNNAINQNVTGDEKNMEAAAATKIQAGFRGYQVRKQLKAKNTPLDQKRHQLRKKSSRDNVKDPELVEKSAVKIQAGVRGFLVRRRQKKQVDSSASA